MFMLVAKRNFDHPGLIAKLLALKKRWIAVSVQGKWRAVIPDEHDGRCLIG